MKKFILFLTSLIFLTGCGPDIVRIGPTGVPQQMETNLPEDDPDEEIEVEAEPIQAPEPVVATQAPQDAVLRLSMRHPLTLNPLLNQDVTVARILRLIFEPLIIFDENLRPSSHLADIEFASDFSSVNLTVRSDAIWSDGKPVTADDIIFSIETLKNAPPAAIYSQNVQSIAQTTRISSRTVQITFNQPSVTVGYALNFPVIPLHYYQGETNKDSDANMNPVGNGLFILDSHLPMRSVTLARNPYSFRSRPQIEQIDVLLLPDEQTELYALDQGRIDALHLPLTEWIRHHGVRHLRHEILPAMYFEFIGFNYNRDMFHELHVRQGIAHAFNADEVVGAVYLAHAVRSVAPIHPYNWAAGEVVNPAFDQARAQALLDFMRLDLRPYYPLVILVNEENPQRVSIARALAQSLNVVGLPSIVASVPEDEYFYRLDNHDFDLFIGGVNLSFSPDVSFLFQQNEMFIHDGWLENAFTAMMIATTESAYLQAVANFRQAFAERLPVVGLAFRHSAVLADARIENNLNPAPDNVFYGINEWSLR